jgi:septal ring factor EnvC (AmiA/AmiB activator)
VLSCEQLTLNSKKKKKKKQANNGELHDSLASLDARRSALEDMVADLRTSSIAAAADRDRARAETAALAGGSSCMCEQ